MLVGVLILIILVLSYMVIEYSAANKVLQKQLIEDSEVWRKELARRAIRIEKMEESLQKQEPALKEAEEKALEWHKKHDAVALALMDVTIERDKYKHLAETRAAS